MPLEEEGTNEANNKIISVSMWAIDSHEVLAAELGVEISLYQKRVKGTKNSSSPA